jgi:uncharacterized protein (TIGR00297 family)
VENLVGLVISMIYILFILVLGTAVAKLSKGASESSRKLVHILVGNWVFLSPMFTDLIFVVLVPFTFIIVNSLSLKFNLIKAMERDDDSLGTVYYAISMFVLTGAGFLLQWTILPFIGLLIMAYGDGLAAIVGKKWGKYKPFKFAPEKSVVGSMTVFLVSFLVTCITIVVAEDISRIEKSNPLYLILIGLLTGFFAVFLELSGKKGSDNLLLPMGTGFFASICYYFGTTGFYVYIIVVSFILFLAFQLKAITVDGIIFALMTATFLYGFGGNWLGVSLLLFFVLGSMVSKVKNERKEKAEELQEATQARNWIQVICNSLPATILVWLYFLYPEKEVFLLLAFAVFSAAAADTFSSELGMLYKGKVFSILTGKEIEPGLSGGVSLGGLGASLLGSFLLSITAYPVFGGSGVLFIFILGIFGGLLDSFFGALIQRKYRTKTGNIREVKKDEGDLLVAGFIFVSNHMVNLLSLTSVVLVGIIIQCL